jgi:N12 class adenine-specific DNA methylase
MTIQENENFFESLKKDMAKKSEIKVYEELLHILSKLKTREFSKDEINSIETELDRFNLESNPESEKKHFSKRVKEFKDYLKEKHSLISAGYYSKIYITTGSALGIVAGIIIGERFEKSLGIALGIGIGMLIGSFVGRSMDAKARSENRIL